MSASACLNTVSCVGLSVCLHLCMLCMFVCLCECVCVCVFAECVCACGSAFVTQMCMCVGLSVRLLFVRVCVCVCLCDLNFRSTHRAHDAGVTPQRLQRERKQAQRQEAPRSHRTRHAGQIQLGGGATGPPPALTVTKEPLWHQKFSFSILFQSLRRLCE